MRPVNFDPNMKAKLVYDGGDELHIPQEMGTPRADQMQGPIGERLSELCGRICYDPETEVLTKDGWVAFRNLEKGLEVATYNRETDRMEFQKPTEYIRKRHRGKMYRVHSTKVSLFTTPDHELYVGSMTGKNWLLRKAEDMEGQQYKIRRQAFYEAEEVGPVIMGGRSYQQTHFAGRTITRRVSDHVIDLHQLPAWATLLGYYISEGTLNMQVGTGSAPYAAIYQKVDGVQPIIDAARACNLNPRIVHVDKRSNVAQIRVGGSTLARYLETFGKGSRFKRLPKYVFEWPARLRENLLDALMAGDGTVSRGGVRIYNTNAKGLADDVQRLMVSLGRAATINYSQCETCLMYRVRETAQNDVSVNKHDKQDSMVEYDGEVFCVSVPNRILFVRRDDKIALCGNCYDSLGRGRTSTDYHKHILEVGHASTIEHYNVTIALAPFPEKLFPVLLNRPGVWTELDQDWVRITLNLRSLREWDQWLDKSHPLYMKGHALGCLLRDAVEDRAPLIIGDSTVVDRELKRDALRDFLEIDAIMAATEPLTNEEAWVSLYLAGSRGFSHEMVRHKFRTAVSQRSTRYVDESHSPYVTHPLVTSWLASTEGPPPEHPSCTVQVETVEIRTLVSNSMRADAESYRAVVRTLEPWLQKRGVDKTSARKQARGAARVYLGNGLETEMIFSASVAQWKHILRMRAADAADAEIRLIACLALKELQKSRYKKAFEEFELAPASDGIGESLKGGGHT